jgi:hypothetical protein
MENEIMLPSVIDVVLEHLNNTESVSTSHPFIEANTIDIPLSQIKNDHIIPVFVKDNQTLISHAEFIETAMKLAMDVFHGEDILKPSIRLSHPIKGRVPSAKDKPAIELSEHEKTLFYERMAFIIEIPSIQRRINDETLSLTIGGVKSCSLDNLYGRKGSDEHFKIFVGFQNRVCTNLCVWTDGLLSDLKVNSIGQLKACFSELLLNYNWKYHFQQLENLNEFSITEQQFAHIIGRCRMYQHLPKDERKQIPPLLLTDTQMSMVVKDYYSEGFATDKWGNINLWQLYNLFTKANKSSYIDQFLERSVNAFDFATMLSYPLEGKKYCWYYS